MILYYAAGGGLGHLTRARAVIYTLGFTERLALLTASPFAIDKRVVGDAEVIAIPPHFADNRQAYQEWLGQLLAKLQPREIYLDSFPAGLVGEFCDFAFPPATRLFHLARLLKWPAYRAQLRGAAPQFERTYVLEPLDAEHQTYLDRQSRQVSQLALADPPQELTEDGKRAVIRLMRASVSELLVRHPQSPAQPGAGRRPLWLIVHAGSSAEVDELIAYALEMARLENIHPRLVLLAPRPQDRNQSAPQDAEPVDDSRAEPAEAKTVVARRQDQITAGARENRQTLEPGVGNDPQMPVERFDFYPASAIFPVAERIITACGFNAMRQTETYREKHRFLPFERRFDNQFARACRRKEVA